MSAAKIIGVIAAFAALVFVVVFAMSRPAPQVASTPQTSTSVTPAPVTSEPVTPSPSEAVVVVYDGSTFSPSQITVKSGQTLTFKNTSSRLVDIGSDPHPAHTGNPQLNVGEVSPGQSKSISPVTKGTYGIHNHLSAGQKATVTVQ
jgi:plastocyanin